MAYDIFGQPLRPGYCEVHPDVPEPYPCYVCLQEYAYHQQEQEMYRQQEPEYSMEDEMKYLRRQRKIDQKLIEEQAAQLKAAEARVKELEYGKALLTKWCAGAEVEIDRLREGLGFYAEIRNYYKMEDADGDLCPSKIEEDQGVHARSLLEVKDEG